MWRLPVAHPERMALESELAPTLSEKRFERGAELRALGGAAAVIAAADKSKTVADDDEDDDDDWSGGFDIHLGVYTND
jgi:hypothetical protein